MVGHGDPPQLSSIKEDPKYRGNNLHPGTKVIYDLHVIPADPPQIMTTAFGPLVLHYLHGMPVNALNPAVANEELVVFASGLGPTNPDVDLGVPFPVPGPMDPPFKVNSPLTVSVNGMDFDVLVAFGVPGTVNTYSARFKMPTGVTPPVASLQLKAAWISGPPINISVA